MFGWDEHACLYYRVTVLSYKVELDVQTKSSLVIGFDTTYQCCDAKVVNIR